MKVLLVAENCSRKMGGEAILPYHYFRLLATKGHEVRLLVHERNRAEVEELFPSYRERIFYITDTQTQKTLWKWGEKLPRRVAETTLWFLVFLSSNSRMRKIARGLVGQFGIDLVHQVIPVSPKAPSFLVNLGAPLVIGPMNGGMEFPPAFRKEIRLSERVSYAVGKSMGTVINALIPGKPRADLLLAANPRTEASLREALGPKVPVVLEVENGVDLSLWKPTAGSGEQAKVPQFVFLGRLVDWKGVDHLLRAFGALTATRDAELVILGGGEELDRLKALAGELGIADRVKFHGFISQDQVPPILRASRALVLPSLFECGGAVVLEAMAMGKAVIATAWGGPADYLDPSCGILVEPDSPEGFTAGLTKAMETLVDDVALAGAMGLRGRKKVEESYDWDKKVDSMVVRYQAVRAAWETAQKP